MSSRLSLILSNELNRRICYRRALDIVKSNCQGQFWLIGGMVYRTLANILYPEDGIGQPDVDLDFIVAKPNQKFDLPEGWEVRRNSFSTYKLIGPDGLVIDFVPLADVYSIKVRELEPTIDNFLTGAPLNIQSIAFDVGGNRVLGNLGLSALLSKTVRVASLPLLRYAAERKSVDPEQYIRDKAESLGFVCVIPQELLAD